MTAKKEHAPAGESALQGIRRRPRLLFALLMIAAAAIAGAAYYWNDLQSKIYLENAEIRAPMIHISPPTAGTLNSMYLSPGDAVFPGQALAKVGDYVIKADTQGKVASIMDVPGQTVGPQDAIVTLIDPTKLRLVGRVQEDKGLRDIAPGQKVVFTADAYGSKQYEATVSSIALSARQQDIVFSISGKREEREFEVTAIFNTYSYPELRNGMSAKMWIYK